MVKLARPADSFYHATQDCLYFVDSEVRTSSSRQLFELSSPCETIDYTMDDVTINMSAGSYNLRWFCFICLQSWDTMDHGFGFRKNYCTEFIDSFLNPDVDGKF